MKTKFYFASKLICIFKTIFKKNDQLKHFDFKENENVKFEIIKTMHDYFANVLLCDEINSFVSRNALLFNYFKYFFHICYRCKQAFKFEN